VAVAVFAALVLIYGRTEKIEVNGKMLNNAILYDDDCHWIVLDRILTSLSGSANHNSMMYILAAAYCNESRVEVNAECWQSPDLCYEWLVNNSGGKEYCDRLQIKGEDLVCYLNGYPGFIHDGIVPDINTAKKLIFEYGVDMLDQLSVDSCYYYVGFDAKAFHFRFDGQVAYDWCANNWKKHIDVHILDIKFQTNLSDDTVEMYNISCKYCFHKSAKYGESPCDDIYCRFVLAIYDNGDFFFQYPEYLTQ